jgi:hypothetical protein
VEREKGGGGWQGKLAAFVQEEVSRVLTQGTANRSGDCSAPEPDRTSCAATSFPASDVRVMQRGGWRRRKKGVVLSSTHTHDGDGKTRRERIRKCA